MLQTKLKAFFPTNKTEEQTDRLCSGNQKLRMNRVNPAVSRNQKSNEPLVSQDRCEQRDHSQ
jgi:hypothetical protein